MALQPIVPNNPMAEARARVKENFDQTALVPINNTSPTHSVQVVGINPTLPITDIENRQKMYVAKDGRDYLSPSTGVMKNGDQVINGNLTVTGNISGTSLVISNGGAKISNFLKIYNSSSHIDSNLSLYVDTSRNGTIYGNFTVGKVLNVSGNSIIRGTLNVNNSAFFNASVVMNSLTIQNGLSLSGSTLSNVNTIYAKNQVISNSLQTLNLNASNSTFGWVSASAISIASAPPVNTALVRNIYCGAGGVPGNLPEGVIYGQYK